MKCLLKMSKYEPLQVVLFLCVITYKKYTSNHRVSEQETFVNSRHYLFLIIPRNEAR